MGKGRVNVPFLVLREALNPEHTSSPICTETCGQNPRTGEGVPRQQKTLKLIHHFSLEICSSSLKKQTKKNALSQVQDPFCSLPSKKINHILKVSRKKNIHNPVPQIFKHMCLSAVLRAAAGTSADTRWADAPLALVWLVLSAPFPLCSLLLTPTPSPTTGVFTGK